jgi:hypothetical protein
MFEHTTGDIHCLGCGQETTVIVTLWQTDEQGQLQIIERRCLACYQKAEARRSLIKAMSGQPVEEVPSETCTGNGVTIAGGI